MNPYVNPNYYNFNQPVIPNSLVARYVNSFEEITANDVPMSGLSVFVRNDRQGIQIRQWSADGRIIVSDFEPKIEPIIAEPSNPSLNDLEREIEQIRATLVDIQEQLDKKPSRRKEVTDA